MRLSTIEVPTTAATPNLRSASGFRSEQLAESRNATWQVRGFVFEAANVLYDDTAWRRWLYRLLTGMGLHTQYAGLFRVWDDEYLCPVRRGERGFDDAFRMFLRAVGLSNAQIQEVEASAYPRRASLEAGVRPLPGVSPTLERLCSAGAQLAVLSDCTLSADDLALRLAGMGLGESIQHCRSSIELHATKPSPTCYASILDDMALAPQEVAFVGYRRAELFGAAASGLHTVAFNWDADAEADVYLEHFDGLVERFAKHRRTA